MIDCQECGKRLAADADPRAVFCSDRCRAAHTRARVKRLAELGTFVERLAARGDESARRLLASFEERS